MRDRVLHAVRGFLMGCAEVVPGVSGGTIALIVGIYERLLAALRAGVNAGLGLARADLERVRMELRGLEWGFLLPLMAGMALAVLIGAAIIPPLIDEFPEGSSALFFGLILASLIVPWRMMSRRAAAHVAVAAIAAVIAFVLTSLPERADAVDPSLLVVYGAAAIAICALTLPGVSGSFLLLAMGLYEPTLDAIHERDLVYVAVFGLGALTGLAIFARVLTRLLRDHRDMTLAALLGLMVGSLRALWPWQADDNALLSPPAELADVAPIVGMGLVGFGIVVGLLVATGGPREPQPAGAAQR
jgi:putative membrane protein